MGSETVSHKTHIFLEALMPCRSLVWDQRRPMWMTCHGAPVPMRTEPRDFSAISQALSPYLKDTWMENRCLNALPISWQCRMKGNWDENMPWCSVLWCKLSSAIVSCLQCTGRVERGKTLIRPTEQVAKTESEERETIWRWQWMYRPILRRLVLDLAMFFLRNQQADACCTWGFMASIVFPIGSFCRFLKASCP